MSRYWIIKNGKWYEAKSLHLAHVLAFWLSDNFHKAYIFDAFTRQSFEYNLF